VAVNKSSLFSRIFFVLLFCCSSGILIEFVYRRFAKQAPRTTKNESQSENKQRKTTSNYCTTEPLTSAMEARMNESPQDIHIHLDDLSALESLRDSDQELQNRWRVLLPTIWVTGQTSNFKGTPTRHQRRPLFNPVITFNHEALLRTSRALATVHRRWPRCCCV
jgi:hypothetical protein